MTDPDDRDLDVRDPGELDAGLVAARQADLEDAAFEAELEDEGG
jgi:hypothetical protein